MFKKMAIFVVSVFAFIFFGIGIGNAAGPMSLKNYSADMESTSNGKTFVSKLYSKDGKRRTETNAGGHESINIMRPDKKLIWMVMPDKKMFMEMSFDMQQKQKDITDKLTDPSIKVEKEFVGNEAIDKHPSKKYHMTIIKDGKKEKSGYIWEATDLDNFPVKYQSEDGTHTTVWKNIKVGGVSDSMFEVPAGYKKMEMPNMGDFKMPRR